MNSNSRFRGRRSIRLPEYDYSRAGGYFVTICAHERKCLFGEIVDEKMMLSSIGKIAQACWQEIREHFEHVDLDYFVVMPNHLHGILMLQDREDGRGVQLNAPTDVNYHSKISPRKDTLSVIIRTYKAAVTRMCRLNGHDHFRWQRNYFERVIRDDDELNNIREYIQYNPLKWQIDRDNLLNW